MKRIFSSVILIVLIVAIFTSCGLEVPRPDVKSGEFEFSVTYELHGEIKTVTGVYVCEYDGVDVPLDGVNHREWSGYIKDGVMEEIIVLEIAPDGGQVELNLVFDPAHFMGDSYTEGEEPFAPCITVRLVDEGLYFENDAKLIEEKYGAKIIGYEYDEPIKNTFGFFK